MYRAKKESRAQFAERAKKKKFVSFDLTSHLFKKKKN